MFTMADVFHSLEMQTLLGGKYVLFFGDSNMRALYKDIITLFQRNVLISENALRKKLEKSFEGDSLLHSTALIKGRNFREHRCYQDAGETMFEYMFITKCVSSEVTDTLEGIKTGKKRVPDVIFMNSTLWDLTRWGFDGVALFKKNLTNLVELLKTSLPEETLVIWQTTPPLSNVRKAFLLPEVDFMKYTIRFEAMEANVFAHGIFTSSGYDVIDFHHHLRLNVMRRNKDGVHWQSKAVRYMTNLLLTHISVAWERALPGRVITRQLDELKTNLEELSKESMSSSSSSNSQNNGTESRRIEAERVLEETDLPRIAVKERLGEVVRPKPLVAQRRLNCGRGPRYRGTRGRGAVGRKVNMRHAPYLQTMYQW